ncbi:O-antigen ligase family protein [uncultured Muribaculum sp.]|uniref:O-antigen ligase family protein n=1 Tax=uncultured Muribaculum sp. TaxID=1918613 RepID=UPI0025B065D1|nr:O-antigen ligase family protein [uncultured Muribaculum sp.]
MEYLKSPLSDRKFAAVALIGVFCIPIMFFIVLLNISNAYYMCAYVIAILLVIRRMPDGLGITNIDLTIAVITALWLFSPLWAICRTTSIKTAGISIVLFGFYLLVRYTAYREDYRVKLINSTAAVFFVVEIFAIITFYLYYKEALRVGFTNLYAIRYLFHPFAETNNCWAQISLLGIVVCVLATRYRLIATYITSIGTLITFSRGAYIALALMIIVLCFWNLKKKNLKGAIIGIVFGVLTVSVIFPHEVYTVTSIATTESQRGSLLWRKTSSERALEASKEHLFLGTGSCSYSMVCDGYNGNGSSFTNYPPNIVVEILVEKGLIGFVVYGLLLFFVLRVIIKPNNDIRAAFVCSLICVILIKEITQATVQNSLSGSMSLIYLLAISSSSCPNNKNKVGKYSILNILTAITVFFAVVIPTDILRNNTEKNINLAISELRKNNYTVAGNYLSSIIEECSGYDIYPRLLLVGIYLKQNLYCEAKEIINGIDSDSGYIEFYNGLLSIHDGDTESAIIYFSKALAKIPSLVKCDEFRQLNDAVRVASVNRAIDSEYLPNQNRDAVKGVLLHYVGFNNKAKTYLHSAINKNSALQIPNMLLGNNEKYNFLVYGAFRNPNQNSSFFRSPTILDLLLREYSFRFRNWYSIK